MSRFVFLACVLVGIANSAVGGRSFVHPGLLQNRKELDFMRQKVLAKEDPWKTAWDHLLAQPYSSLDFQPKPVAHVIRGSFGKNSVGDRQLMDGANAAYSQALQWFVTRDPVHARKAAQIIDAWSGTLWDFQDNDAKLLAGWTGHTFCNAAEILRYTGADWNEQSIAQFRRMLLTVYYPLIRNFFPEANGNWDAAIMDTMLCIGVECDDPEIFQQAVDHFERGPGNGGIAKYVYPNGQCQESTRDQGHTQLGLGELLQACQVAANQNVDLYGAVDNRLALGIEFTARYMEGESVPSYGPLSTQSRGKFSDIYEAAWQHYHFDRGMDLPAVARAIEKTRATHSWAALTMFRGEPLSSREKTAAPLPSTVAEAAGALDGPSATAPTNAATVNPDESIQAALDAATPGSWIVLAAGTHRITVPLRIPSGVTLAGRGNQTIVFFEPSQPGFSDRAVIINASNYIHDVTLRDFVVDAGVAPAPAIPEASARPFHRDPNNSRRQRSSPLTLNRAGIIFAAAKEGQMRGLRFEHLTVTDCTHDGIEISGAAYVVIEACNMCGNGGSVPPGPGLEHDLVIDHTDGAEVRDSRLDDSLKGTGLRVSFSQNVLVLDNELARNALDGLDVTESHGIQARGNFVEANDRNGILFGMEADACRDIEVSSNLCRNNGLAGIRLDGAFSVKLRVNSATDNGAKNQTEIVRSRHTD
jgi:hypothetical protein